VKLRKHVFCKLHQLSFVTPMVSVNLSDMLKPDIPNEVMAKGNSVDTRSSMVLRAGSR
jgi:hypothetical protein